MKSPVWQKALKACADPPRARHFLEQLAATSAGAVLRGFSEEQARILAALFSGSHVLGNLLVARGGWVEGLEGIKFPRRKVGIQQELASKVAPLLAARDYAGALGSVREFKQRQMLRIAARDLARLGNLSEIVQEISNAADVCLEAVWEICRRQLRERFGTACHQDARGRWLPTAGCLFGLGKLGGQELNYSSD